MSIQQIVQKAVHAAAGVLNIYCGPQESVVCLQNAMASAKQIAEHGLEARIDHRNFRSQIALTVDSVYAARDSNSRSAALAVRYASWAAEEGLFLLQAAHIRLTPPPNDNALQVFTDLAHQQAKAAASA
ncbi:MAG: hypothetical protein L0211_01045 [Planctomycetaceae bacterium]|nr:hypothetical protein [Planctomycetaceae bacterium]